MDKAAGQRFLNKGTKDGNLGDDAVEVRDNSNLPPEKLLPSQSQIWLGKAIIIHSESDDKTTQPTGAAGARIGCGEVKIKTAT